MRGVSWNEFGGNGLPTMIILPPPFCKQPIKQLDFSVDNPALPSKPTTEQLEAYFKSQQQLYPNHLLVSGYAEVRDFYQQDEPVVHLGLTSTSQLALRSTHH